MFENIRTAIISVLTHNIRKIIQLVLAMYKSIAYPNVLDVIN